MNGPTPHPSQGGLERCAVRITPQVFTDEEKTQARANIGAVAEGGSSNPFTWTYSTTGPVEGEFITNDPSPANTTQITFSTTINSAEYSFLGNLYKGSIFALGANTYLTTAEAVSETGTILLTVTAFGVGEATWSGSYSYATLISMSAFISVLEASAITPVSDGTYTMGIGVTQDSTITVTQGIITGVTEIQM